VRSVCVCVCVCVCVAASAGPRARVGCMQRLVRMRAACVLRHGSPPRTFVILQNVRHSTCGTRHAGGNRPHTSLRSSMRPCVARMWVCAAHCLCKPWLRVAGSAARRHARASAQHKAAPQPPPPPQHTHTQHTHTHTLNQAKRRSKRSSLAASPLMLKMVCVHARRRTLEGRSKQAQG
jgi:hypothetical protein